MQDEKAIENNNPSMSEESDYFLDITNEICPMTFVKTKLMIERIAVGDVLEVRLKGREPLNNVPRNVVDHGHEVLSLTPEIGADGTASEPSPTAQPHRLLIRKV